MVEKLERHARRGGEGEGVSDKPYVVITADSHAGASVETYRDYLDAEAPAALRRVARQLPEPAAQAHRQQEAQELGRRRAHARHGERGHRRRDHLPEHGAAVLPTSVLICGNPSVEDYPLWLEGIRAHNRWLVDFCAEAPERRAGIGLVYLNDIDEAIEDVEVDREARAARRRPAAARAARLHAHHAALRARDRALLGRVPGPRRGAEPARRHGLARLRARTRSRCRSGSLETSFYSTRSYPHLLLVGRVRALPEAPLHHDRVGLRVGARRCSRTSTGSGSA